MIRALRFRVMAASDLLNEQLGAVTHVEQNSGYVIRGESCPLSALTGKHPAVGHAMESLVKEFVGASVHECCERAQRPRCCFEITSKAPGVGYRWLRQGPPGRPAPGRRQLQLRGKFSEDHPIASGISDRGGLHVV